MTPIGPARIGTAWFLDGIANLQQEETRTQRELSSGYQINDASDSPAQTPQLIQLGSTLAAVQTYQTNLGNVQAEATTADQTIGQSISLLQNAEVLATQGASSTTTLANAQLLAAQVQGIQQQLVSLANTTVAGRWIFGGDQDQSAPYQYNAANLVTGADLLTAQTSTRVVVDTLGQTVYQPLTAQQIFDPADALGNPTANNAFAALESLYTALQANNQGNVANALTSLQNAMSWVNQQQAYYGAAESRLTNEQNNAANQITALQTQIGGIRDTNMAEAATDLAQEQTDMSAAMGAQAEMSMKTLFDYLG
jgi:flagellar hook-associated protein 3 FlgL